MGFIEETGAAQYYRDSRILTIYEGTTGIQSNDLVGRKTQRDGGAVALALADRMQETAGELAGRLAQAAPQYRDGLALIHEQLGAAIAAYRAAVQFVLDHAREDVRAVYAGSVPYLMLAGYVVGGWHMARAALVCETAARDGVADPFMQNKFATAVFYAGHILPRAGALVAAMRNGVTTTAVLAMADLV